MKNFNLHNPMGITVIENSMLERNTVVQVDGKREYYVHSVYNFAYMTFGSTNMDKAFEWCKDYAIMKINSAIDKTH